MLSEEALILTAVAGACMLLVLGVLELVWPSKPRKRPRRLVTQAVPSRPLGVMAFPRPVENSVFRGPTQFAAFPRRTGEAAFPPPPGYVAPTRTIETASPRSTQPATPPPPPEPPAPPPLPVEAARPRVEAALPLVEVPRPLADSPRPPARAQRPFEDVPALEDPPPIVEVVPPVEEPLAPTAGSIAPAPLEEPEPLRLEEPEARPEPIEETASSLRLEHDALEAPPEAEPVRPAEDVASLRPLEEPVPPLEVPEPPPPRRRRRSKVSPHARAHRVLRGPKGQPSPDAEPAPSDSVPVKGPGAGRPEPLPTITRDSPLVEACFALYQEKRFTEVVEVGQETLAKLRAESLRSLSRDAAAIWSVVGLAKQALGDEDGAHAALESSIDAAPDAERATYRRHLATLALDAARVRLARGGSHDTGDRIAAIRSAIAWTERGLGAIPSDPALVEARESAHEALWDAYEQAAGGLLQRQEFRPARQLLREALDDPALPAARAAEFRGLHSGTLGGEIGQLTAHAILCMQEAREGEALGALRKAEELLEAIPNEALPPSRRDEVDQRLWWGYAELGSRRLETGDYEEALDPLLHALRFDSIGPDRQTETRAAVVRALEGIAAVRALSIRRLADDDRRNEAVLAAQQLRALVKNCRDVGLSEDELVAAFARVRRLCEELGMEEPT